MIFRVHVGFQYSIEKGRSSQNFNLDLAPCHSITVHIMSKSEGDGGAGKGRGYGKDGGQRGNGGGRGR